jgi:hypothetical protein
MRLCEGEQRRRGDESILLKEINDNQLPLDCSSYATLCCAVLSYAIVSCVMGNEMEWNGMV